VNDDYFYPFNLKIVEITGEIKKEKWLMVDDVSLVDDDFFQEINVASK
jgi:hypothetical protein